MDTIDQNKNTVTAFIDALFTKGDLGAIDEYLAEDSSTMTHRSACRPTAKECERPERCSVPRFPTGTAR